MAHLLEPLALRSLKLANRLVLPPIATARCGDDGLVNDAILTYYDEKSRGGWIGLIIIEHCFIAQQGRRRQNQLSAASDETLPGLRQLADTVRGNGSAVVLQLNHAGSAADPAITGLPAIGPSAWPNPSAQLQTGSLPLAMTAADIAAVTDAFRQAAIRARTVGFDGVEIHSAHGYLLNQFYSPITNRRTDAYGGPLLNRIRLHLEVIEAVRDAVGPDFPILLRLGACDYMPGGSEPEDAVSAARAFADAGVDILDISGGLNGYVIPGVDGQGYFAPVTAAIRQAVPVPVILTGGITDADAAEHLLAEGAADLIGVGRAIVRDSGWAERAIRR